MRDKRIELLPSILRWGHGASIFDCSHFLFEYPSAFVPLWGILKRSLKFKWTKMVFDGSLPSRHKDFSRSQQKRFRTALTSIDEFIVVSGELERWLRDEIGSAQPISLIPPLLPEAALRHPLSSRADIVNGLAAYRNHARRVCSVGVFVPEYGFEHVAHAVERLRRETNQDIGLMLLDGEFVRDEIYERRILHERDWITVLRNVELEALFEIFRSSHVFVRAFGLESYGLSRIEAIWCGLPVVATRAGETRGMLLYDFGDVNELTGQLRRALSEGQSAEAQLWAARYRQEAEENLRAIALKMGVEPTTRLAV